MHDPLTGLGNRRFLDEHLDLLVAPAQASNTELVCIAIDMDNLKQVNDTLGHASGDDLLQLVAELIRGQKRLQDYGVRLGGDEFIVLMPGCDHRHAQAFAQRLRSLFQHEVRTLLSGQVRSDLSMGIAALSDGPTTGRQLLQAADERLYAAKRDGKGQAVAGGQVRP